MVADVPVFTEMIVPAITIYEYRPKSSPPSAMSMTLSARSLCQALREMDRAVRRMSAEEAAAVLEGLEPVKPVIQMIIEDIKKPLPHTATELDKDMNKLGRLVVWVYCGLLTVAEQAEVDEESEEYQQFMVDMAVRSMESGHNYGGLKSLLALFD